MALSNKAHSKLPMNFGGRFPPVALPIISSGLKKKHPRQLSGKMGGCAPWWHSFFFKPPRTLTFSTFFFFFLTCTGFLLFFRWHVCAAKKNIKQTSQLGWYPHPKNSSILNHLNYYLDDFPSELLFLGL